MRLGLPGKEGRKEGRLSHSRANTYARGARCNSQFYERGTKVSIPCRYRGESELNFAPRIMLVQASSRVASRRVAPRQTGRPHRAELCRAGDCTVRTGQLNRSGGFSIFCLSTMAAAAQKWLSARNTRHYTSPYSRAPFLFLSPDPRGSLFHLPTPSGLSVYLLLGTPSTYLMRETV